MKRTASGTLARTDMATGATTENERGSHQMTKASDRDVQHVIKAVTDYTKRRTGHPGMPTTVLPLQLSAALHKAVADGKVRIIERPSKIRPGKTYRYIVPIN